MNEFIRMTKEEFKKVNDATHFWKNGYNVVIYCSYIQEWLQFAEALGNAFQLPMRGEGFVGTRDWMQDLNWLGEEKKISLYLYDEERLFQKDFKLKKEVYEWLEDLIQF